VKDETLAGGVRPRLGPRGADLGFLLIGLGKVASGVLFLGAGIGIYHMIDRDLGESLERLVALLRLDPGNHYIHAVVSRVSGIDRRHLREIAFGTFFYAGLHLVEGTGLLLRRHWAEYLTVVATSSLVPLEGYEVIRGVNVPKMLVLAVNLAIVAYLIARLRRQHRRAGFGPG
jgi:uncharacterized membrane protein (DUF2068 family)